MSSLVVNVHFGSAPRQWPPDQALLHICRASQALGRGWILSRLDSSPSWARKKYTKAGSWEETVRWDFVGGELVGSTREGINFGGLNLAFWVLLVVCWFWDGGMHSLGFHVM